MSIGDSSAVELALETELEGSGVDPARLVLAKYDKTTGVFQGERSGDFWDAVNAAHDLGRRGEACRVAVIDTGFDSSLPFVNSQVHVRETHPKARTAHGTAVALLVHEVAPMATLDLYPVSNESGVDLNTVVSSIESAAASQVDIINLSLGRRITREEALDPKKQAAMFEGPSSDQFVNYATSQRENPDWRTRLKRLEYTPLERAVTYALQQGCTVVAAAGNTMAHVYSPALVPGVIAVGFVRVMRSTRDDAELAQGWDPVGYEQTPWADYGLTQPAGTLGSSFAAPLISGFAATMPDRELLSAYLTTVSLAGAADLQVTSFGLEPLSPERYEVADRLYEDAVNRAPHRHWSEELQTIEPCPECILFAGTAYINGGRHWLLGGRLEPAEAVLRAAAAFAPANPHAAANLAVTLATRADRLRQEGELGAAAEHFEKAVEEMRRAAKLRPDHLPYQRRLKEFENENQALHTSATRP